MFAINRGTPHVDFGVRNSRDTCQRHKYRSLGVYSQHSLES